MESELACGRSGLRWVLVDEVCADGEGTDVRSLETPMFRDGALFGSHLLTVDATHLWSLDLTNPNAIARASLVTGLGQPLSVQAQGDRLYVAAGLDGLVVVDAAVPSAPSRGASIKLPSPAYDLDLRAGKAYVAMGKSGVAVVDVAGNALNLASSHAVPGYAAGVTTDDAHVYVAACAGFSILDRATGSVKSSVAFPKDGQRLLAPAKDVALVGKVAFVAAGRQGAVAIDVSVPETPRVIGRCSVDEPSFYASGVRAQGNALFVAGGEWGVLRVDVTDPLTACTRAMARAPAPKPPEECSKEPPWEIVPWDKVWTPPPPGKDPIQVLPVGDRVFAFGDARRIGVRAVDVRAASDLVKLGRYDEPRMLLGLAVQGPKLVAIGPRGGVFNVDGPSGVVTRAPTPGDEVLVDADSVAMLDDGRFVVLEEGNVHVQGKEGPIATSVKAMDAHAQEIATASARDVDVFAPDGSIRTSMSLGAVAKLPLSITLGARAVYYAAPEWLGAMAQRSPSTTSALVIPKDHGIFDIDAIMDADLWRIRVPRRHLAVASERLIELAALGSRAGLAVHGASGEAPTLVDLPVLTYAGLAADEGHAYAIGLDRGLYKSYLVTVSLVGTPRVLSMETFTGAASGVAAANGRVYVADGDGAVRVYTVTGDVVAPLAVTRVEVRP